MLILVRFFNIIEQLLKRMTCSDSSFALLKLYDTSKFYRRRHVVIGYLIDIGQKEELKEEDMSELVI